GRILAWGVHVLCRGCHSHWTSHFRQRAGNRLSDSASDGLAEHKWSGGTDDLVLVRPGGSEMRSHLAEAGALVDLGADGRGGGGTLCVTSSAGSNAGPGCAPNPGTWPV